MCVAFRRQNHPLGVRRDGTGIHQAATLIAVIGSAGDFTNREDTFLMATLTAWAFNTVDGAEQASQRLQALQSQELIKIQDAAVVSWEEGKKKPKTRQLSNMTAAGALGGTFWGMLLRIDLLRAASRCCDRRRASAPWPAR